MKKYLLFLSILLASISGKAQSYHHFLDNTDWYEKSSPMAGTPRYYWYHTSGDTIIGGKDYKIITQIATGYYGDNTFYLREDTVAEKVYNSTTDTESLLYDLSLSIGESYNVNSLLGSNLYVLSSIDTVATLAGPRRRYYYTSGVEGIYVVEGIGSITDPMLFFDKSILDGPGQQLVCAYQYGVYVFQGYVVPTCTGDTTTPITAVASLSQNEPHKINIYPNPVNDVLTIKTDGGVFSSFKISNTLGATILQNEINNSITNVSVTTLPPGLYYVTLKGESGVVVKKFVKE